MRHIWCRGNRKQPIFVDDFDRERFLVLLAKVSKKLGWRCVAYCLMGNHVHLVIDVPALTISRGMQLLNGQYAQAFNRRHGYVGHLFQGRFSASRVDDEAYSLQVGRYVVLNPVRAGMVGDAVEWSWSSHRAMLGKVAPPPFLDVQWTLGRFARKIDLAREAYTDFISAGQRALEQARPKDRGQTPGSWAAWPCPVRLGAVFAGLAEAVRAREAGGEQADEQ
jgi:REP element-mobilizing transposase RayT